jgi:hypothetical protein
LIVDDIPSEDIAISTTHRIEWCNSTRLHLSLSAAV